MCSSDLAGVGFPQFSAVLEVAAAIKGSGVPVIADGGIRYRSEERRVGKECRSRWSPYH